MSAEQFAYQSARAGLAGGAGCALIGASAGRAGSSLGKRELNSKARFSLTKRLQLKFGELLGEARQRIEVSSEPELDRWLEQTITAENLDSVFR